jgi:hypothetical protein
MCTLWFHPDVGRDGLQKANKNPRPLARTGIDVADVIPGRDESRPYKSNPQPLPVPLPLVLVESDPDRKHRDDHEERGHFTNIILLTRA